MSAILIGDYDWGILKPNEIDSEKARDFFLAVLEKEQTLTFGYEKIVSQQPGLVRTLTKYCNESFLKHHKLDFRMEALINIAVNAAKHQKEQSGADVLIAGVLGPIRNNGGDLQDFELERIFSEPVIYQLDRGVESLLIEGFSDFHQWEVALKTVRKVNSVPVPIAAFLKIKAPFDLNLLQDALHLYDQLEIELLGFEIEIRELGDLIEVKKLKCSGFGLMLHSENHAELSVAELDLVSKQILEFGPTLLLGGAGLSSIDWQKIKDRLKKRKE